MRIRGPVFVALFLIAASNAPAADRRSRGTVALDDLMTPDEIAQEAGLPEDHRPEPALQPLRAWRWFSPEFLVPTPFGGLGARQYVEQLNEQDKDLAQVVLIVNKAMRGTTAQQLRMYVDGVERMVYTVSTGREKYETAKSGRSYWTSTPTGYFRPTEIKTKHYSNTWQTWLHWVIFFKGGVAVHATTPDHYDELGSRASGGCVRVREEQAKEIFDQVTSRGRGQVPVIQRDGTSLSDAAGRPALEENWNSLVIVRNIED